MTGPVVLVSTVAEVLARWPDPALTTAERGRLAAFRSAPDAAAFTAAHLLAREGVAQLIGRAPADIALEQTCETCGGPHGRPTVRGFPLISVSWSHTRGSVAAIAAPNRRVGIDIEPLRALEVSALLRRTATPAEAAVITAAAEPAAAYLVMWTRKEALVKIGRTTLDRFAHLDVTHDSGLRSWVEGGLVVSVAEGAQE